MKRKPRWEGKRKVGIAESRRDIEPAIPKAVPRRGAVRRVIRRVDGATRARMGRTTAFRLKG